MTAPARALTAPARLVVLRDGTDAWIRPLERTDIGLVAESFTRMSAESRRLRFLMHKPELTTAELRYLTDVDHWDHEALVAPDGSGRGLGIARFFREPDDERRAEVAIAVVDEAQGKGLGTRLMSLLFERAREVGIRHFTALVSDDNPAIAALLRSMSDEITIVAVSRGGDTIDYDLVLAPAPVDGEIKSALRALSYSFAAC